MLDTHQVQPGDNASAIAAANGISLGDLMALNPGGPPSGDWDVIFPGDRLVVGETELGPGDRGLPDWVIALRNPGPSTPSLPPGLTLPPQGGPGGGSGGGGPAHPSLPGRDVPVPPGHGGPGGGPSTGGGSSRGGAVGGLIGAIGAGVTNIGDIANQVKNAVSGALDTVAGDVRDATSTILNNVGDVLNAALPTLGEIALGLLGGVQDVLGFVGDRMVDVGEFTIEQADAFVEPISFLGRQGLSVLLQLFAFLGDVWGLVFRNVARGMLSFPVENAI